MATPWLSIERMVMSELNLIPGDTEAAREAIFVQTSVITTSQVADEAFNRAKIRAAIVEAHQQIIRFICLTDGHPRRSLYRQVTNVNHLGQLPSAMGPYGNFSYDDAGEIKVLSPHIDPREVDAIVNDLASANGVRLYYYAIDSGTLHATVSPVIVESFDYPHPISDPSQLSTLFDSVLDLIAAPDEFVLAIKFLACGILALTAASFQEGAASYLSLAETLLKELGITVTMSDFYKQNQTAQ